jgi:hypothetical protein
MFFQCLETGNACLFHFSNPRNPCSPYQTKKAVINAILERHKQHVPINSKALQTGATRNSGLYEKDRTLFGSWPAALKTADVAWDGKRIAKTKQSPQKNSKRRGR